jgi:hypothetical protein
VRVPVQARAGAAIVAQPAECIIMPDLSGLLQIRVLTRIPTTIREAVLRVPAGFAEIRGLQAIQLLPDNTNLTPGVQEAILSLRGAVLKDRQVIHQDLTVVLLQADLHIAGVPNQEVHTLLVLRQAPPLAEGHRQVAVVQEGDNLKQ